MTHDNPNGYIRVTGELTKAEADTLREAFKASARDKTPLVVKGGMQVTQICQNWYRTTSEWQVNKLGKSLQRQIKWLMVDMERLKGATGALADAASDCEASLKNLLRVYREENPDE